MRIRDNWSILDGVSYLTNRDVDRAEAFNAFFTSVLDTGHRLWIHRGLSLQEGHD